MNNSSEHPDKTDILIDYALSMNPDQKMSDNFTDKLIHKIEKKLALREVLINFCLKILIISSALGLVFSILFLCNIGNTKNLLSTLLENWQFITIVLIPGLFIFIADQIFIKYFLRKAKHNQPDYAHNKQYS